MSDDIDTSGSPTLKKYSISERRLNFRVMSYSTPAPAVKLMPESFQLPEFEVKLFPRNVVVPTNDTSMSEYHIKAQLLPKRLTCSESGLLMVTGVIPAVWSAQTLYPPSSIQQLGFQCCNPGLQRRPLPDLNLQAE